MTSLTGDDAKAHVRKLLEEQRQARTKKLDLARQDGSKERFDLDKLGEHMDVRSRFQREESTDRAEELEREYYLAFPEVKTLREYASIRERLDQEAN